MCKSADLLLMVLDATKPWTHKEILTRELEAVGIRLNRCAGGWLAINERYLRATYMIDSSDQRRSTRLSHGIVSALGMSLHGPPLEIAKAVLN